MLVLLVVLLLLLLLVVLVLVLVLPTAYCLPPHCGEERQTMQIDRYDSEGGRGFQCTAPPDLT